VTTLDQAIAQMRAVGMPDFPPGHPVVNAGRIIRFGPKKKAWYRLHEVRSRITGDYVILGDYGSWGEIESRKIEVDWRGIAQEERERLQAERAAAEAAETKKRIERARFAGNRARAQWEAARSQPPQGVATYLARKGVAHEKGLRYLADGTLLVPMIRYDVTEAQEADPAYTGPRRLVGLQKIAPDGEKRFNKGMAKEGAACRLGRAPARGEALLVTEGLATGLSIRMAIGGKHPVFVAFDAGNLAPVAKGLRALHPESPMLLCADDDAYLAASLNKLLAENYGATATVSPPVTAWKIAARSVEIEVSADWTTDANGVLGIVGAVTVGGRTLTLTRENAGRVYAHRAALAAGNAAVIHPTFKDRALPLVPDAGAKLTDFNDLHQAEGLAVLRAQLEPELERLAFSLAVRRAVKEELGREKKGARAARSSGGAGGGSAEPGKPSNDFDWRGFFERFTLIYPTDTLWDATLREIVKLHAVTIAFGGRAVKFWLESADRRTVNLDQLMFEPGADVPAGAINLYRGMPVEPSAAGSCEKLLALLQYLCGEAERDQAPVTDWVLRWLAYPLQHPGAKMQTAIVMHGPEGTGKNLFFGAVRDLYGEYGTLITQTELEDRFNGWLSRRLLLIANEVISRQELRHHVGRLKNMVTEPVLPIREMFTPIRYESNHANMVFLTNELQAILASPGDRRYMVIRTPAALPAEYYRAAAEEAAAGGVAALYAYLLALDCAEFNPHTKPILTAAKEDLIEIGLSSTQFFQQQLHDGLLWPLAYGPCLSSDLYRAYLLFCQRTGERNPARLNRFSHEFMAMNGVRRSVRAVGDPDLPIELAVVGGNRRQATVFVMGEGPPTFTDGTAEFHAWLRGELKKFRDGLRSYAEIDGLRKPRDEEEGRRGYGFDG